jgi:hypothetical protein
MRIFRRRPTGTDANEIAIHAAKHSWGGRITAIGTVVALVFSGFSLWETSLKQADLTPYVTGVLAYERDQTADVGTLPSGGFEVLAVPITIANSGARDGVVLAMQLEAKNLSTGLTARFAATYAVDGTYFAATGKGDKRPKTPFSALVVAGRAAWTGTVLFYPVSYSDERALTPIMKIREFYQAMRVKYAKEMGDVVSMDPLRKKHPDLPEWADSDAFEARVFTSNGKADVTLKLISPAPSGWLDRTFSTPVAPVTLTLEVPNFGEPMAQNEVVRLRTVAGGS